MLVRNSCQLHSQLLFVTHEVLITTSSATTKRRYFAPPPTPEIVATASTRISIVVVSTYYHTRVLLHSVFSFVRNLLTLIIWATCYLVDIWALGSSLLWSVGARRRPTSPLGHGSRGDVLNTNSHRVVLLLRTKTAPSSKTTPRRMYHTVSRCLRARHGSST